MRRKRKVLAIVGSISLQGSAEALCLIDRIIDEEKPDKVVSGGADGIDSMAIAAAKARGIDYEEFLPKTRRWWDGFMPRNILIAEACTKLVRIVAKDSTTYGSGWTRDYARDKLKKPTEEYVI